jgi:hypothetical protein
MDEENRDIEPVDVPEDEEPKVQPTTPREPINNDYMAGAILANGIIWFWMLSLNLFKDFSSRFPPAVLVDVTYVTLIVAGFVSSQQVAKRSEKNQLVVAIRSAFYSWVGSIVMMITMPGGFSFRFALTVLICLMFGAVIGSYMLIRDRIILRRRIIEASS